MRISDWSSDVCSSDLALFILLLLALPGAVQWLPGASAWNSAAESSTQESALPNRPQRIATPSAAPPVEEVKLMQIAPEKARLLNAATPFSALRSEEHTSELQSLMRISYAVFCLKKKKN